MEMKRIRVLAGVSDKSQALAKRVIVLLSKNFVITKVNPDLLLVVGGDGTLLHHIHKLGYPELPFLGIDAGGLGFFQELKATELAGLTKTLKTEKYNLQQLPLLELKSGSRHLGYAFNEFAIERGSARATHLSLSVGGHKFEKLIGDGLIIATPQGSTAYASAAGGAVLPYDLSVFEVVPSNPHQSANYQALRQPLVLSSDTILGVEILEPRSRPVRIVADGHEIKAPTSFSISVSGKSITMLRTHKFNFYERLSSKLIG